MTNSYDHQFIMSYLYSILDDRPDLCPDGYSPSLVKKMIKSAKVFYFGLSMFDKDMFVKNERVEAAIDFGKEALDFECFKIPFPVCLYVVDSKSFTSFYLCFGDTEKNTTFLRWFFRKDDFTLHAAIVSGSVRSGSLTAISFQNGYSKKDMTPADEQGAFYVPIMLTALLACGGIKHNKVENSRQVQRRAKREGSFLYSFTSIEIDGASRGRNSVSDGAFSGVRAHWRRGHFRRLASGAVTSVRPCLVGDKSLGFVDHDYGYSFT